MSDVWESIKMEVEQLARRIDPTLVFAGGYYSDCLEIRQAGFNRPRQLYVRLLNKKVLKYEEIATRHEIDVIESDYQCDINDQASFKKFFNKIEFVLRQMAI